MLTSGLPLHFVHQLHPTPVRPPLQTLLPSDQGQKFSLPACHHELAGHGNDRTADDAAVQEEIREQGLQGMFRHANSKAECEKLDLKWAEAISHAGLPPSIIEDEYIRDAILQTSLASAPYTPAHRTTFETKLLPAVDAVRKGVRRE